MKRVSKLCWTTAAAVLLLGMLGTGAMAYSGGSGAQGDPYRIADLEDLKELRDAVNGGEDYRDVCFLLTGDIELDCDGRAATQWTPIGTYSGERHPFRGIFDGGGHVIHNLYISRYYCDSEPQYLDIPERPLPPEGVRGVDASSAEAEDGKLTGVTDDMEYTTGDEAWQMITDEEVTDLPPGVYLVRYQGDYNYFAGEAVEIRIGVDGEEPDPDPEEPDPDPDPEEPDPDPGKPDPTPEKPQPAPSDDDDDGENTGASSAPSSNPTSKPSEMETKAFPFTDVRREAWYYGAVEEACAKGLMRGMSDTLFEPEKPLTRGEAVTVLYRLEGSPAVSGSVFGDIPAGHVSAGAVAWATREGLVKGFVDGTFRPNMDVTREQLATILWRYAMWKGWDVTVEGELSGYMDLDQISSFALPAMEWTSRTGLISGTDWGGLAPQTEASRGEAAAIFVRQSKR